MELNATKCKVMHCGRGNPRTKFIINERELVIRERERDLGIIMTPNMKWHEQANHAASKANRILGVLRNAFVSRDIGIWKRLYTIYIRPHLEFAVQVWCPYTKGDVRTIEKAQRRATKIPHCLKDVEYPDRCQRMGIEQLTERRERGDLIEMFKLSKGLETVSWVSEQKIGTARVGRRAQMRREIVKNNQRHNFFPNRVAGAWNALPDEVVEATSVNEFKIKLDKLRTDAASKGVESTLRG